MQSLIGVLAVIQIAFILWAILSLIKAQRQQAESLERIAKLLERSENIE